MDGGDPSLSDKEEEEEEEKDDEEDFPDILSKVRFVDAPILLFVCFHKALRSELHQLRRLAETASLEDQDDPQRRREVTLKLRRRFNFLKLACKYHCAAEDEVIFIALDTHVKNVVSTYSLEHKSINELFDSVVHCLDELMGTNENISMLFQELVYCIGVLQTSIYQHMLKEEEQVFPLVMQKLSTKEQASLVWQFICSVPIMLLAEVLPWMVSSLPADKQGEVAHCLKEIAPMEKALQEVLVSWLGSNNQTFTEAFFQNEEVQGADGSLHMARSLGLSSCNKNSNKISSRMKSNDLELDGIDEVNVLHLWHDAIKKDLEEILKELHLLKNASCFHNLESILLQLKFFADLLIFYSNAQKNFFHPVLNKLADDWLSKSTEQFLGESHIEDLQQLLLYNSESGTPLFNFIETLCRKLELIVSGVNKQFAFQEVEVFPVVRENWGNGMQERLLSLSLHMMPLGLLKCVTTWFSVHLSEKESRFILYCIKKGNHFVCEAFSSLLHEWFRIGYSGKTSIEKFRQDLQHMFKSRFSFLPEQSKEATGFSSLNSDLQPHKVSDKWWLSHSSSSGLNNVNQYETPYSTGISQQIFFPATTVVKLHQRPIFLAGNTSSISFLDDPKPIDLIFFFHKAMKKDLDYLVLGSAQLEENAKLLMEFQKRFHLIFFLHQIHSDAEDEVVFPALEAMGKLKNISHAYTFDHKLEVEHFNKISRIIDKISELHLSVSTIDSSIGEKRMQRHHHLCRKLQEMCKSMHKVLSDHIDREEIELWPLTRELFSNQEQGKIMGCMLGRIRAEILQDMIPWLMASLTLEEQHVLMFLWSLATKNTMFDEWLGEWWDGYSIAKATERPNNAPTQTDEPLEIISKYLSEEVLNELQEQVSSNKSMHFLQKDHSSDSVELSNYKFDDKVKVQNAEKNSNAFSKSTDGLHKHAWNEVKVDITNPINNEGQSFRSSHKTLHYERLLKLSQEDLEMAIRRVSRDSSLDLQKKSYIIQNLLMSRWIIRQKIFSTEVNVYSDGQEFHGNCPSYRDPLKLIYGCKHYKRNCKLLTPCCNQLHTCMHCHNEVSDHSVDRKSITKMMCMKCLVIQPIGATCSTVSCCNLSMAKYYCRICKLYDDEREIYHCPYCNLCRVGKGLGVDYFHCMDCNACMSRSLMIHTCREKSLEDNCPICHEYIFTSCSPVKALPCGHVMHSKCFQEYTCFNYTCPICCKSLGDMKVYYRMLDALLAEEKNSDELSDQTQDILCNDCEKKGAAPFHWLHHKCPHCGSYNTRVL